VISGAVILRVVILGSTMVAEHASSPLSLKRLHEATQKLAITTLLSRTKSKWSVDEDHGVQRPLTRFPHLSSEQGVGSKLRGSVPMPTLLDKLLNATRDIDGIISVLAIGWISECGILSCLQDSEFCWRHECRHHMHSAR
jgi:hypothetical protein